MTNEPPKFSLTAESIGYELILTKVKGLAIAQAKCIATKQHYHIVNRDGDMNVAVVELSNLIESKTYE